MSENFSQQNQGFEPEQETVIIKKETVTGKAGKPRKISAGMFGIPEIIAVGLGLLSLVGVGLFYVFFVVPTKNALKQHQTSSNQLEQELKTSNEKFGNITTTKEKVEQLINSVDSFERNYLPIAGVGKAGLYQRVNNLISAYNLTNTTGPDFSPLEISEVKENQQNEQEKGRSKFQSLFPGVYVSVTVEGSYQNLRRFIREIESSGQFVIISTIELEASENSESGERIERQVRGSSSSSASPKTEQYARQPNVNPLGIPNNLTMSPNGQPLNPNSPSAQSLSTTPKAKENKGKTRGEYVSLHLEMAAYFRRSGASSALPSGVANQ
jgi:Tfp pilus assembly protein PilO